MKVLATFASRYVPSMISASLLLEETHFLPLSDAGTLLLDCPGKDVLCRAEFYDASFDVPLRAVNSVSPFRPSPLS
jgi:hypothetical protein